ncbi:MAG: VPLPA-CTERM sorting domain-containing protein [Gammaproteobacteria bacterium]|nr:VPLPA-CTERM sorting domain-containing protein [Gammaproteobacteria bacterium]
MKKSKIVLSLATAFGAAALATSASAVQIAAGSYSMEIQQTPCAYGVCTIADAGTDGNWNSTFTFDPTPATGVSQRMTDTGPTTVNGVTVGVSGDGIAGALGITVDGDGNIAFTSAQFDAIYNTAGGTFIKYIDTDSGTAGTANGTSLMSGLSTMGETTFALTGLLGGVGAFPMIDNPWDYGTFTTGASTANGVTNNGTAVANVGDVNGDGLDDYTATFVMGSNVGAAWGDFNGAPFVEVLKVEIMSTVVPVPAAVWLFGSGLVGLAGIARRRKA